MNASPPARRGKQRKDASMDLLNDILRNPVEPEYRLVAGGPRRRSPRLVVGLVAAVIGAMFALSAVQTVRTAPVAAQERDQLIRQVREQEQQQDALRSRIEQARIDNDNHRSRLLTDSEDTRSTQAALEILAPGVGDTPVQGPGVVVIVDDAPEIRTDKLSRVLDKDLQMLVNGLWEAGAEAVSVNGHRLSSVTAIRSAGDAITVDYRSLTRPYQIEAIGDPRTLAARFAETSGGQLWQGLEQNYQMRFDLNQASGLTLRADPGLGLRYARKAT